MKAFIVLLCVAAALAEPEADAQYLVNPYSYTPYNMYNNWVNPAYQPLVQPAIQPVAQPSVYYSKPVEYQSVVYKAEEVKKPEEKVEVKPVEYKAVPLAYNAMSYAPASPVSPMYYALNPTYYGGAKYIAQSAGGVTHTVNKREAMEHMASPMVYTTAANPMAYYVNPMSYYASPLSYSAAPVASPLSYSAASVMPAYYNQMMWTPKTYANDAMNANVYAAKGQYVADSVGARHVAKREAEAQMPFYPTAYNTPYMPYAYNALNAYKAYTPYTPYTTVGYPYNTAYSYYY